MQTLLDGGHYLRYLILFLSKIRLADIIENPKHINMLDPLSQAWQSGSALAGYTLDRTIVNKHRLCGSLLEREYYQRFHSKVFIF